MVIIPNPSIQLPGRGEFPLVLEEDRFVIIAFFALVTGSVMGLGISVFQASYQGIGIGQDEVLLTFDAPVRFIHAPLVEIAVIIPVGLEISAVSGVPVPVVAQPYIVGLFVQMGREVGSHTVGIVPFHDGIVVIQGQTIACGKVMGQLQGNVVLGIIRLSRPFLGIPIGIFIFDVGSFVPAGRHLDAVFVHFAPYGQAQILAAPGTVPHPDLSCGLLWSLGNDIDHASYGIGAVQGGSAPLHHFDPLDPVYWRQGMGIKSGLSHTTHTVVEPAAVHHHQHPFIPVEHDMGFIGSHPVLHHTCSRHIFQGIGNVPVTPVRDLLAGDHRYIRRRIGLGILQPVGRNDDFFRFSFRHRLFCPSYSAAFQCQGSQNSPGQFFVPKNFHFRTSFRFMS